MLRNYIKTTLRNLRKNPGFSFINLAGLAIGMAACMLIAFYVRDEVNFDRFNKNADRIYRVVYRAERGDGSSEWAYSYSKWGEQLEADFPGIEASTRLMPDLGDEGITVKKGDEQFQEHNYYFADANIFHIFSIPLRQGDPGQALVAPHSIVISQHAARKYFGNTDPLGKILVLDGEEPGYTVTGVFNDLPDNSHLHFDFLLSLSTVTQDYPDYTSIWVYTYVLLKPGTPVDDINARMPEFLHDNLSGDGFLSSVTGITLQPLTDIHFYSNRQGEPSPGGSWSTVCAFSIIAGLILAIACFNFMNLATARSANRGREVGVRKVFGAQRKQLITQFIGEAILLCLTGFVFAIILAEFTLPFFNKLAGKTLSLGLMERAPTLLALGGLAIIIGIFAGSYPAFYLSAFKPTTVLKGNGHTVARKAVLRQVLVVAQFAVSISLIIGTGMVYDQLQFIQNKQLGFDKEQLLSIPVEGTSFASQPETFAAFKQQLLENSGIKSVTGASNRLGERIWIWPLRPEGWKSRDDWTVNALMVGDDYVRTYGMQIVEGRNFSKKHTSDQAASVILNESAARFLGWDHPVGRYILLPQQAPDAPRPEATVIGIVKDFNFASLHEHVAPLVLIPGSFIRYVTVRLGAGSIPSTLRSIEETWTRFIPDHPMQYAFVNDQFNQLYKSETQMSKVIAVFSFLAILVACLGLFGLAAYTTMQRKKEIGVRKVLGASVPGILVLLFRDFMKLVFLSFLIAVPVAWGVMNWWLRDFAYRMEIRPATFLLAGALAALIALATVSWQSMNAALADPVNSLRNE